MHIVHRPVTTLTSLFPHRPYPFPPALISFMVSVDVKDHVYLLTPCFLTYTMFTYTTLSLHRHTLSVNINCLVVFPGLFLFNINCPVVNCPRFLLFWVNMNYLVVKSRFVFVCVCVSV